MFQTRKLVSFALLYMQQYLVTIKGRYEEETYKALVMDFLSYLSCVIEASLS